MVRRADWEKLKKHKSDMDADRKKRGLPAFLPRPRGVSLLEVDDRQEDLQTNDEEHGDYEVTGLMCDSDGDCDCIEIDSRENTFGIFGGDPSQSETFSDYEIMCCVCGPEKETTTIHLDVTRVVLPPADDGRVAETHRVSELILTIFLYFIGMFYVLGADSSNRGPGLPTPWSHILLVRIKTETITPHFGMFQMFLICVIGILVVLIDVWSRRFEEKTEHDVEIWSRRFEKIQDTEHHVTICTHSQDSEDEQKRCVGTAAEHKQVSGIVHGRSHEMMIDDGGDKFEQAPADQALALSLAHAGIGGQAGEQGTEDDCERCLCCLISAEVHRLGTAQNHIPKKSENVGFLAYRNFADSHCYFH